MRRLLALIFLAVLLGPVTVAAGQEAPETDGAETALGPGDVIRVQVYREPELTGDFLVDVNGVVTLPLIGPRRVIGIPLVQLRESIVRDYLEHLRNPSINITPLRRIDVLGEVLKPGTYVLDPTVTLSSAISMAGGPTQNGDIRKVQVLRQGSTRPEPVETAGTLRTLRIRSGDQIVVRQRNWVTRNRDFLLTSMVSMVGGIVTTLILVKVR